VITDRGRELLQKYPKRIDISVLNQFPEFVAFRSKHSDEEVEPKSGETIPLHPIGSATPEEAIDVAEKEISGNLQSQLLERIFELSPAFFEQLVLELIVKMGYGGAKGAIAEKTGGSGDEGFDGIVNEDPLGLDKIYLQAKRYAKDNTIGQDHILLMSKSAKCRLATFLADLWLRLGNAEYLDVPMSYQDIADHLGLTIETVSRTITDMERSGMVTRVSSRRLLLQKRIALGHMMN
jgi:hypothetical protein